MDKDELLKRFDELLDLGRKVSKMPCSFEDMPVVGEGIDRSAFISWQTRCVNLLTLIAEIKTPLRTQVEHCQKMNNRKRNLDDIMAILQACRDDVAADMFSDLEKRVEAGVAVNYLEQAEQLMADKKDANYTHVAAAVLVGAVLEKSLRTICKRHNPPISLAKPGGKEKTINPLIDDLKKANYFNEIEAKQLRTWADIRNAAAHGHSEKFLRNDVSLMIDGIQNFLERHMN